MSVCALRVGVHVCMCACACVCIRVCVHTPPSGCICVYIRHFGSYVHRRVILIYMRDWHTVFITNYDIHYPTVVFVYTSAILARICADESHVWLMYMSHFELWIHRKVHICVCISLGSYLHRRVVLIYMSDSYIVVNLNDEYTVKYTSDIIHLARIYTDELYSYIWVTHIYAWLVYCHQFELWIHSKIHVGYHSFGLYLHRRVVLLYTSDSYIYELFWTMNTQEYALRGVLSAGVVSNMWLIYIWVILNDEYTGKYTPGVFKCWGHE